MTLLLVGFTLSARSRNLLLVLLVVLLALFSTSRLSAQTAVPAGRVVVTYLDSKLLRGNAAGENPRRRVSVYLPAGYDTNSARRYPVL